MIKKYLLLLLLVVSISTFSGCSKDQALSDNVETPISVSGVAQKGPFLKGSSVKIYRLDSSFERSKDIIETKVTDDDGSYTMDVTWSGLSEVEINGYYFDELTAAKSTSAATLSSIIYIDPILNIPANVNLFTHMASTRIRTLLQEGKSILEAKDIALQDLITIFELVDIDGLDISRLDLTDLSGSYASVNAALLRISAAFMNSDDPLADLELLVTVYNENGLAGLLESDIYAKIQLARYDLNMQDVLTTMEIDAQALDTAILKMPASAIIDGKTDYNAEVNQVELKLFNTKFNDRVLENLSIISTPQNSVNIKSYAVADDNMSAVFDINYSECSDSISMKFSIESNELNISNSLETNRINLHNMKTVCAGPTDDNSSVIEVPDVNISIIEVGDENTSYTEGPDGNISDIEVPDSNISDIEVPDSNISDIEVPDENISVIGIPDDFTPVGDVVGSSYEAKAILSSKTQLEENNLDGATLSVSLANGLTFVDDSLDISNFILQDAPLGVSIYTVEYVNQRDAIVTLAFDGTDINVSKQLSVSIYKDELNSPVDVTTNSLVILEDIAYGYADINKNIPFHASDFIYLGIAAYEDFTLSALPSEGNASTFKIGNEFWAVDYSHTSCNLRDTIVYDSTDGKGKINIDVEMSLPVVADENISINHGGSVHEYVLVNDSNVKGVFVYPPKHGTASVIFKDDAYLLNYEPDGGFIGTEELALTINSDMDGCTVSSNIVVTINVSLVKNYEMFSARDVNGTCHPYVTDGNSTQKISGISLQSNQCDIGYDDYKKVGSKFIFSNVGGSPMYRVNPASLAFSSWSDYYADMENSLVVNRTTYIYDMLGLNYGTHESALIHTAYVKDIGTMPWGLKTINNPYLVGDAIGEVDGDQIVSNYMQDYTYQNGYRQFGSHVYSASYDWSSGNGLSLSKDCAFTALESCTSGDIVHYYSVDDTKSNTGTSSVSLAVDKRNVVYVYDNQGRNLWVTVDLNLDVLSMSDQTRYMDKVNFSSMDLQRANNGVVYYDGYNVDTSSREIGYLSAYATYTNDIGILLDKAMTCSSSCTLAYLESSKVENFFDNATMLHKIANIDKSGSFFVADDKIYVLKNMGAPLRLLYWHELDVNGTLTELPSQTSEDSKAAFKSINTIEYINGYIYMIGSDRYDSTKNKMVAIDTKNSNATALIEFDKEVVLYKNGLYKNDYNFHQVIYKTRESDGAGGYIFNVYGYNPYKNEKTLLQTYVTQP